MARNYPARAAYAARAWHAILTPPAQSFHGKQERRFPMLYLSPALEKALSVFVLIAFGGTVLPALLMNGGALPADADEGGAVMLFYAGVYLVIIALVMNRPRLAVQLPLVSPVLTALILLAGLSAVWSLHPDITVRRTIALLFTTTFAVYMGLRWSLAETLSLLAVALGGLIVVSYVFIFAIPAIGIDHFLHEGAWKGVFWQKNVTGRMLVWFFLAALWLLLNGHIQGTMRTVTYGVLAMGLVMLPLSQSGTALLSTFLVVGILLLARGLRGRREVLVPMVAVMAFLLVAAVLLTAVFYRDILFALGRDVTLTGRTELWEHTTGDLRGHWLGGWGYAAYWWGSNGPAALYTDGWGVTSAHNGWIEVMLDMGLPGLVLMALLMLKLLAGGALAARYGDPRNETWWVLAVGLGQLAISMSESLFLERHSLNWVVFVIAVVRVSLLWRGGMSLTAGGGDRLRVPA